MQLEPAVGYIRVSRVGGRGGDSFLSPREQRKAIEADAAQKGFIVIRWLEEMDKSGADAERPLWNQAIEMVERGEVAAVAVWNLSRFSRSVVDGAKAIERVESAGGKLYSSAGDSGDSSPAGQLQRNMFLAIAQFERDQKKESFDVSRRSAIDRGIFVGAKVPVGYDRDPETRRLVPNEMAPVVSELFELRAKGWSWGRLAKWYIEHGGPKTTRRQSLQYMIKNRTYLGEVRQGVIRNPNAHPPLVSQRVFDEANAQHRPGSVSNGRYAGKAMLGGIIRCDGCGHRLTVTASGGDRLNYVCKTFFCDARAGGYVELVDAEVTERIFSYLSRLKDPTIQVENDTAELAAERRQAQKAYADAKYLLDKFEANRREYLRVMEPSEFAGELTSLKKSFVEAEQALTLVTREPEAPHVEDFRTVWGGWTNERRNEWLRDFLATGTLRTAGKSRRIPISERVAIKLAEPLMGFGDRWLLADGQWSREPFGEPSISSKLRLAQKEWLARKDELAA